MKLKLTVKGNGRGIPARCYFRGSKIHERETDVGTSFEKGQSGKTTVLPKDTIQVSTRIQRIFEGEKILPVNVQEAAKALMGGSKKPVDAVIVDCHWELTRVSP